jgi:hypothetical protein
MDELTGNQSQLTGADDFSLQSNLPDRLQTCAESGSSETLESNIIAQSLDFKDWMAEVQTTSDLQRKLTAKQVSLFHQPAKSPLLLSKLAKQIRATVSGRSLIEISEVEILIGDSKAFWGGNLENPREGDRLYGTTTLVSGWVITRQAKAAVIHLISQGKTIAEAPIMLDRPDVKKAYSLLPDSQQSGFCLTLNFQTLPREGAIEAKVMLADQTLIVLGSFNFTQYTVPF